MTIPRSLIRSLSTLRAPLHRAPPLLLLLRPSTRFYTTTPKQLTYDAITSLKPTQVLIDVREPSEFAAGAIPGANNMPLSSAPDALVLPEDEFEERFGFKKPARDAEVVFYCKAGVRSRAAAELAVQAGYTKVAEYPGSWIEWVKKTNEAAK